MKTDEAAIVGEIQAFSDAWNKGDAKLTASFFTEDGVRVGAMGDRQQGRAELEAAYDKLLHGPFAGASVRQERGSVRCEAFARRGSPAGSSAPASVRFR
jgi:uncharacterized protein (TIGR02246 family)